MNITSTWCIFKKTEICSEYQCQRFSIR